MRAPLLRFSFLLSSFLAASCGDTLPELQQRATTVFEKAKDALARNDHLESRKLLSEVVALDARIGNSARYAEASLMLAENFAAGGEFSSALPLYQQAHQLYTNLGDKPSARAATIAHARILHQRGDDDAAYRLLNDAIQIARAFGEIDGVRELQLSLIPVARAIGHVELEEKTLSELEKGYAAVNNGAMRARAVFESGQSSLARENFAVASQRFLAAAKLAGEVNSQLLAIDALQHAAIVSDKSGNSNEAFRIFSDGLRRTDATKGAEPLREEMLLRVGNIYFRQQRYDDAKKFLNFALRSAIKSRNKFHETYALLQLGSALSSKNSAEATKTLQAGADLAAYIGLPSLNAYAQALLGRNALSRSQRNEALNCFRSATEHSESSHAAEDENSIAADCARTEFGADRQFAYTQLIELLSSLGKTDEAFLVAQRKDAFALRQMFVAQRISTHDNSLNSALSIFEQARGNAVGAENALVNAASLFADSRVLLRNVQQSLTRANSELRNNLDSIAWRSNNMSVAFESNPLSINDVQKLLSSNAAVVRYVATKQSLYIFIISQSNNFVEISAIENSTLISTAQEFHSLLSRGDTAKGDDNSSARLRELSARLHQAFIRPLEARVAPSTQLLILLPLDVLLIPLHALQNIGARAPFAIERFQFLYFPTLDALKLQLQQQRPSRVTIIFGNQGNTSADVEYELRDLQSFAREARLYFSKDASLQTLQRESGDILHCALDIRFNARAPQNSYFVLSDGRGYTTSTYPRFGELFSVAPFATVVISNLSSQPLHASVPFIFKINGTRNIVTIDGASRKAKKFFNEVFYTFTISGSATDVAYRTALLEMIKNPEYTSAQNLAPFFLW